MTILVHIRAGFYLKMKLRPGRKPVCETIGRKRAMKFMARAK